LISCYTSKNLKNQELKTGEIKKSERKDYKKAGFAKILFWNFYLRYTINSRSCSCSTGIFLRIYLQITRGSNGVDNIDMKIVQISRNSLQQKGWTAAEPTCPGVQR